MVSIFFERFEIYFVDVIYYLEFVEDGEFLGFRELLVYLLGGFIN